MTNRYRKTIGTRISSNSKGVILARLHVKVGDVPDGKHVIGDLIIVW